jgi:hypothetical protein
MFIIAQMKADGGEAVGFVAKNAGRAICGAGLMAIDWPPHPAPPLDDRRG